VNTSLEPSIIDGGIVWANTCMDLMSSLIHAIVSTCYFYRHAWYTPPDALIDTCNREYLLFLSARMGTHLALRHPSLIHRRMQYTVACSIP
jgi:hypothetical protein